MSTYKYKSDAAARDVVLKSAVIAFIFGLAVNIPVAIVMIAVSAVGCYDQSAYIEAVVYLPAIHIMVFVVGFVLITAMYYALTGGADGTEKKE